MEKWKNKTTYYSSEILDNSWPSTTFSDRTTDHSFKLEQLINCFLCEMKFTDIDELLQHQVMHICKPSEEQVRTQPEYFNCKICGRSLRSELKREKHHNRFHASHLSRKDIEACERYKRDQCDNVFNSLNYLENHMKSDHQPSLITIEDDDHMKSELKSSVITIKDDDDDSIGVKVTKMIIKRAKIKYPPRWPFCNPNFWLSSADVI